MTRKIKTRKEFTALRLDFHFRQLRMVVMNRTWTVKIWVMLMSTKTFILIITIRIWIMINRRIIRFGKTE